jgi:HEPN domain-containing protein
MPRDEVARGSPEDWLKHARSDLALAQSDIADEAILLETLCFHAHQAVEKALKAVLVHLNVEFLKTHNIKTLTELLPEGVKKSADLNAAAGLTDYAVSSRYPGESEPVSEAEFREALRLAQAVLHWAEEAVEA